VLEYCQDMFSERSSAPRFLHIKSVGLTVLSIWIIFFNMGEDKIEKASKRYVIEVSAS